MHVIGKKNDKSFVCTISFSKNESEEDLLPAILAGIAEANNTTADKLSAKKFEDQTQQAMLLRREGGFKLKWDSDEIVDVERPDVTTASKTKE